jgi:hypothetical protein
MRAKGGYIMHDVHFITLTITNSINYTFYKYKFKKLQKTTI